MAKVVAIAGASGAVVALLMTKLFIESYVRRSELRKQSEKKESSWTVWPPPATSSAVDAHVCSSERVQKFVLTGGPCGGKTTALARLKKYP